jgi:hypothetical protein
MRSPGRLYSAKSYKKKAIDYLFVCGVYVMYLPRFKRAYDDNSDFALAKVISDMADHNEQPEFLNSRHKVSLYK